MSADSNALRAYLNMLGSSSSLLQGDDTPRTRSRAIARDVVRARAPSSGPSTVTSAVRKRKFTAIDDIRDMVSFPD
jgi:hypothetical protein